jgi:hypothetical protein
MKLTPDVDFQNKILIHDIEVFQNWFSNILLMPKKNKLIITMIWDKEIPDHIYTEIKDSLPNYEVIFLDFPKFIKFLDKFDPILIGYNSYNFDDNLLTKAADSYNNFKKKSQFLDFIYKEGQVLIKSNVRTKKRYTGIDLMRVSGLDRIFKPMKQTAANLRHHLIKDLPKKHTDRIELEDIVDLVVYEVNDVEIPEKMLYGIPEDHNSPLVPKTAYKGLMPAIDFRVVISEYFGINLTNSNKSQIGEKLAVKLYSEASNRMPKEFRNTQTNRDVIPYKDVIFDNIVFETEYLKDFLKDLKRLNYEPEGDKDHKKKFKFEFDLWGLETVVAQGGLHGVSIKDKVFIKKPGFKLIDLDVGSYYPSLYWKYFIEPEHLPGFNKFVGDIITLRLKYKKAGNKLFANGLKIAINRIYGGFSDDHGWLKDDKALLKTTINGQLMLLMLIERLHLEGIETYYANTDGITVICPDDKEEALNAIWKNWEDELDLILERDDFAKSYIRDVNNFVNVKENGSIKLKGSYDYISYIEKYGEFDLSGSFNMPIVQYAAVKHFTENIPVEDTIKNHIKDYPFDGIYDFCIAKKSGGQFKNVMVSVVDKKLRVKELQKSIRYFISKSNNKIFKIKEKTDKEIVKLVQDFRKGNKSIINSYVVSKQKLDDPKYRFIREINGRLIYVIESIKSKRKFRKEWLSYTDVMVDRNVTLFNEPIDSSEYEKLDFDFYIEEARKLVDAIEKYEPPKPKIVVEKLF